MNKQLRYSTHILAILMMTGSIPSLMANRAYFFNDSSESIIGRFVFTTPKGIVLTYDVDLKSYERDKLIFPDRYNDNQLCNPSMIHDPLEYRLHSVHIKFNDSQKFTGVYKSGTNPAWSDVKIVYEGNGNYRVQKLD